MTLLLADGRRLSWAETGDPAGKPVLALHGSPGSLLTRYPYPEHLVEAGIRLITYSRPGYGDSDPKPDRQVADVVGDVTELLDHLGIDRLAVSGGSGGGPHALALATLLPDRFTVVSCNVGVAPPLLMGEEAFFDGMDPENVRRFRSAQKGREAAGQELGADLEALVGRAKQDPTTMLGEMKLPEADLAILREIGSYTAAAMIEAAKSGPWGIADDFVAIAGEWGFDPREASAPVHISYGAHDVNVPAGQGKWLADNVPNVGVTVTHGGHLAAPADALARLRDLAAA